jgi:hypothetical protein
MDATSYHDIKGSLRQLYLDDPRPWLVGFSIGYPPQRRADRAPPD